MAYKIRYTMDYLYGKSNNNTVYKGIYSFHLMSTNILGYITYNYRNKFLSFIVFENFKRLAMHK